MQWDVYANGDVASTCHIVFAVVRMAIRRTTRRTTGIYRNKYKRTIWIVSPSLHPNEQLPKLLLSFGRQFELGNLASNDRNSWVESCQLSSSQNQQKAFAGTILKSDRSQPVGILSHSLVVKERMKEIRAIANTVDFRPNGPKYENLNKSIFPFLYFMFIFFVYFHVYFHVYFSKIH